MLLAAPRLLPQDQTSPKTEQKPTPSGTTPPPPKPAPTTPLMKFQYMKGTFEPMGDLYVLALGGGVDLNLSDVKAGEQELEAETVVLWLDRSDLLEEFAERGERLPTITPGEKTVFEAFVGLRSLREFYAEGSVRFH